MKIILPSGRFYGEFTKFKKQLLIGIPSTVGFQILSKLEQDN